jgi:hypothetical protein
VTRGKRLVVLVGQRKALAIAVITGSHVTLCWREMDSNFRFRAKGFWRLSSERRAAVTEARRANPTISGHRQIANTAR